MNVVWVPSPQGSGPGTRDNYRAPLQGAVRPLRPQPDNQDQRGSFCSSSLKAPWPGPSTHHTVGAGGTPLPSRGSGAKPTPWTRPQAEHRRAPVDKLPCLLTLPFRAVGPLGQQLWQAALMGTLEGWFLLLGGPVMGPAGHRTPTCAAVPAWGGH